MQTLGDTPSAILRTPPSTIDRPGHIDAYRPHDINHLVVDFLGNEEILVTAHDDGEVIVHMLREIIGFIQNRTEMPDTITPITFIEPRVFYQKNLGKSAWGIAVHNKARRIAFSANTRNVTVVQFHLAKLPDEFGEVAQEYWMDGSMASPDNDWSEVVLKNGHRYNIPCVSFLNGSADPKGRYLASIDLEDIVCIWDLENSEGGPIRALYRFDDRFVTQF
jgi:hypothetical protein